ncbi:NACHT domain-containing protein [Variovorax sp. H27-G14]|uniref:NACHT domain-containing protein n=1 Tax=Variovorax sp. H27-G14 TaxID=3111914 RepID=UPI0038FC9D1D
MARITRLPEVRPLSEILPKGTEGGKEFSRIVDLLLFYSATKEGRTAKIFSDRSGDYFGLDSFQDHPKKKGWSTGYQYKFFSSPLSASHRSEIKKSLLVANKSKTKSRIENWILVTPDDLSESSGRLTKGDVSWFEGLKSENGISFNIEHWGHRKLQALFLLAPSLCLFYYPELVTEGALKKKNIAAIRATYDKNLVNTYSRIEFVGMSVYKPEATRGVEMADIYIPVSAMKYGSSPRDDENNRINPLSFLARGALHVVLGDPGSGKSTLLKFLALVGNSSQLQLRYTALPDSRLPILVILRKYADALRENKNISLLEYISLSANADFSLRGADQDFFEYYLESGNAILLFDGLDELPNPELKKTVRDRIDAFSTSYPLNTVLITSRIVGYDNAFSFNSEKYAHYTIAPLTLSEMDQFVSDWYRVRLENESERQIYVNDLKRIFRNPEQKAIRNLAENPLLLTIVALVHRIDAVLPDERVVLYQKCTETLLNTWHTWKYRGVESVAGRGRVERSNRRRIEALATYMQLAASTTTSSARTILTEAEVMSVLAKHILAHEGISNHDDANDIADEFLRFVRQRAGLLIEVGESQYSFVHLTFQEYLTATALAVDMEFGGIEKLWNKWNPKTADPRWHEIFRLLVAGMKSDSSQEYLVKHLMQLNKIKPAFERLYLLGGILVDGIKCTDEQAQAIVRALLFALIDQKLAEERDRLVSLLRAIFSRYPNIWHTTLQTVWVDTPRLRELLLLAAFAVGMNVSGINSILYPKSINCEPIQIILFSLLFGEVSINHQLPEKLIARANNFEARVTLSSVENHEANAAAVSIEGALSLAPNCLSEFHMFCRGMLAILVGRGPFADYFYNKTFGQDTTENSAFEISQHRAIRYMKKWREVRIGDYSKWRTEGIAKALDAAGGIGGNWRNRSIGHDAEVWSVRDLIRNKLNINENHLVALRRNNRLAKSIDGASIQDAGIHILIESFNLEPADLWRHALGAGLSPVLNSRKIAFTQKNLSDLEGKISSGTSTDRQKWEIANFLLYDIWLYVICGHESLEDSPVAALELLVSPSEHPAIQIALAFRRAAYGDDDGVSLFANYANQSDGGIAEIIKCAFYTEAMKIHQ